MNYRRVCIAEIREECRETKTFVLDYHIASEPGQFLMVWIPGVSENPISISGSEPCTSITVRRVGDKNGFSHSIFRIKEGDNLWIRGPYGRGFIPFIGKDSGKDYFMVAGGCGAAPLAYLSEMLYMEHGIEPIVLLGAGSEDSLLFRQRFEKCCAELYISTDDGSRGEKGLVTGLIKKHGKGNSKFFICGPEEMMAAAAENAMEFADPADIILSLERYMKCGTGLCGSCDIGGYRVCTDGPVFSYKELEKTDFGKMRRTSSGKRIPI